RTSEEEREKQEVIGVARAYKGLEGMVRERALVDLLAGCGELAYNPDFEGEGQEEWQTEFEELTHRSVPLPSPLHPPLTPTNIPQHPNRHSHAPPHLPNPPQHSPLVPPNHHPYPRPPPDLPSPRRPINPRDVSHH